MFSKGCSVWLDSLIILQSFAYCRFTNLMSQFEDLPFDAGNSGGIKSTHSQKPINVKQFIKLLNTSIYSFCLFPIFSHK